MSQTIRTLSITEAEETALVEIIRYFNDMGLPENVNNEDYNTLTDKVCEPAFWESNYFNPLIIKTYSEEVEMEEGCLSYPELFLKIKRPDRIVVKYEDVDRKTHKVKLQGVASRVFQHEYDHMEGIDFTQRVK